MGEETTEVDLGCYFWGLVTLLREDCSECIGTRLNWFWIAFENLDLTSSRHDVFETVDVI